MKIGIIIPSTSKGREWNDIKESYLFKHTLKTFLLTYDKEHNYTFYIGIDKNDRIYDNQENISYINKFISLMKNIEIQFIIMNNIPKGHLTKMWNCLFEEAYNDDCDYFFQCGDDIEFITPKWINNSIDILIKNNNVGVSGPIDINNTRLLTQSFVSRKHMELFGYYFPPEIINWFCDDWINEVYRSINKFFPLQNNTCINVGGNPRYNINNKMFNNNVEFNNDINKMRNFCTHIVRRDLLKVKTKI